MNVVISHTYSRDNKGDAALISVLIDEVNRAFGHPKITILTVDRIGLNEKFEGVPIKAAFMYFAYNSHTSKLTKLILSVFMMTTTLAWAYWYKASGRELPLRQELKLTAHIYKEADLIIPVGGGYLRTSKKIDSFFNLLLLLHPMVLSKIIGKPTILYSQSVGPFHRKSEERLLKATINKCVRLVLIREDKSMRLLEKIGVKNTVRSVDAGFLLKGSKKRAKLRSTMMIPDNRILVGVTVRNWLEPLGQKKYEVAIAKLVDYLVEKHSAYVIFIPQVTVSFVDDNDLVASHSVFERVHHKDQVLVLEEDLDHHQIKTIYDELDLIVGTRFHSIIFSLTSYVPALAIEYEHKTSGIMHDLGLDEWVIKIEDVTPNILKKKMDNLVENRAKYMVQLRRVMPSYIKEAKEAIMLVKKTYETSFRS